MTFRDRFRALFSPRRRWIDATGTVLDAGGPLGPKEAVLPRSRATHRRFDFRALPSARRRAALDLAVRHGAPVPGSPHACRWQGGVAHVWSPIELLDLEPDVVLVAESSLVAAPASDGVRLVALRDGFEGQAWVDGQLIASRWWPDAPTDEAWQRFLRAAGRPIEGGTPAIESFVLSHTPWGEPHGRVAWSPAQLESAGWRVVAVLVALVVGWQLAAATTWTLARALQAQRLDALRADSAPLIAAREQAEAAQHRLVALEALVQGPSDLDLLAEVRRRLGAEVRVVAWTRDVGRLRIDLQGAGDDPRPIVQAFADHPLLGVVVANPQGGGRMQLDIDLDADTDLTEAAP